MSDHEVDIVLLAMDWIVKAADTHNSHEAVEGFLAAVAGVNRFEYERKLQARMQTVHTDGGRKGGLERARRAAKKPEPPCV